MLSTQVSSPQFHLPTKESGKVKQCHTIKEKNPIELRLVRILNGPFSSSPSSLIRVSAVQSLDS